MRRFVLVPWTALVAAFLIGPIVLLLPLSLNPRSLGAWPETLSTVWYRRVLTDEGWTRAFGDSVLIALVSAVIATAVGLAAAFAIVRGTWRWKSVATLIVLMPMILPVVATAESIYFLFVDLGLDGTVLGIGLGQAVLALPTAVIVLTATLGEFDHRLELAAMSLGASRPRAIARVTLPMIWPGVAAGFAFAFLTSFDELIVALFLSSPTLQTLPVKVWAALEFELDPSVAAVSVLIVGLVMVMWLVAQLVRAGVGRGRIQRKTEN